MSKLTKQMQVDALLGQVLSGKLDEDKAKIINYLRLMPCSTAIDINKNIFINLRTVSGRLSDLLDLGCIKDVGHKVHDGSKSSTFIYVSNPEEQKALRKEREQERYIRWLKKGKDFISIMQPLTVDLLIKELDLSTERLNEEIDNLINDLDNKSNLF